MPAPAIAPENTETEQSLYTREGAAVALPQPQHSRTLATLWQHVDRRGLSYVAGVYITSRLLLLLATAVAAYMSAPGIFRHPTPTPFWRAWFYWDSGYYVGIARFGYRIASVAHTPAFFPLFPIMERLFAPLTQGNYFLAGFYAANIAWFLALYGLYRLARYDFGVRAAQCAVIALSVFPTAFFSFVPYPESLFLALSIASVCCMRQGKWGQAALWGMLASQTRLVGVLLVIPFTLEFVAHHDIPWKTLNRRHFDWQQIWNRLARINILWVALIPTGTLLYIGWLWHAVGDPLAFVHAENTWHRETRFPLLTLWDGLIYALKAHGYMSFRGWQEFLIVAVMLVVAILSTKIVPLSYSVFSLILIGFFLLNPQFGFPLESQSRYLLELFPLFIALGVLAARHRWLLAAIIIAFLPLQLVLMGIFSRGGWIT